MEISALWNYRGLERPYEPVGSDHEEAEEEGWQDAFPCGSRNSREAKRSLLMERARTAFCLNCRFFDTDEGGVATGKCRKEPPRDVGLAAWPTVKIDDWCGAWQWLMPPSAYENLY